MNLSERDKAIIWHPFTQEKTATPVLPVQRAQGSYVYDEHQKPYLDLISSWWVNLHGHAHPEIARAIYDQACTLEHILFAGFTHEPAVQLCELLKTILPKPLTRFFFSDNGSTCVEVALKMASQYWHNQGRQTKTLFLSFEGGYHGDTFGAMSVGAHSGYHDPYKSLLFKVLSIPFPATWEGDEDIDAKEREALACLEQHLLEHADDIAAIILEPLMQGASGMRMCRPTFVKAVVERVRQAGILVIFDEVMTGFGRTGTSFALEQTGLAPDFLCVSKGITGGFLPLALTITTDEIHNAFLSDHWHQAFAHGHSYTANPIACAAAVASFNILCRDETQQAIQAINEAHRDGLNNLKNKCPNINKIRRLGTIAAFDVIGQAPELLNPILKQTFLQQGLLIRPLGNTVYLLPPYSTTPAELRHAYEVIGTCITELPVINHD